MYEKEKDKDSNKMRGGYFAFISKLKTSTIQKQRIVHHVGARSPEKLKTTQNVQPLLFDRPVVVTMK